MRQNISSGKIAMLRPQKRAEIAHDAVTWKVKANSPTGSNSKGNFLMVWIWPPQQPVFTAAGNIDEQKPNDGEWMTMRLLIKNNDSQEC